MASISKSLLREFEREAQTTRKHLERLPKDKLGWRPHDKSFTAGELASHIVECIGWADSVFNSEELDIDPTTYDPYQAKSVADLLRVFDDKVAICKGGLAGADDEAIMRPWRFKVMGQVKFEHAKADVLRDFILSHLIHHRGQFSVYLRLLNVPVPGSYGPTADEQD
ncbi:MAG: DinB family protein [Blastocatellia bacterium]|nr:DinB family protein [Blastocatellia bacterium]